MHLRHCFNTNVGTKSAFIPNPSPYTRHLLLSPTPAQFAQIRKFVRESFRKAFKRKEKKFIEKGEKNNILIAFSIFHKSSVKIFLK